MSLLKKLPPALVGMFAKPLVESSVAAFFAGFVFPLAALILPFIFLHNFWIKQSARANDDSRFLRAVLTFGAFLLATPLILSAITFICSIYIAFATFYIAFSPLIGMFNGWNDGFSGLKKNLTNPAVSADLLRLYHLAKIEYDDFKTRFKIPYQFSQLITELEAPASFQRLTEEEIQSIPTEGELRNTLERLTALQNNIDHCHITLNTPMEDPTYVYIYLYKEYQIRSNWQLVPGTARIFQQEALKQWMREKNEHPEFKDSIIAPEPYDTHPTRYRWHLYKNEGSSKEFVALTTQIREGLLEKSRASLLETRTQTTNHTTSKLPFSLSGIVLLPKGTETPVIAINTQMALDECRP